jgi:hypothetical protein
MNVCIGGEHIAHLIQSNHRKVGPNLRNKISSSYTLVPNGTTQGKVCHLIKRLRNTSFKKNLSMKFAHT